MLIFAIVNLVFLNPGCHVHSPCTCKIHPVLHKDVAEVFVSLAELKAHDVGQDSTCHKEYLHGVVCPHPGGVGGEVRPMVKVVEEGPTFGCKQTEIDCRFSILENAYQQNSNHIQSK